MSKHLIIQDIGAGLIVYPNGTIELDVEYINDITGDYLPKGGVGLQYDTAKKIGDYIDGLLVDMTDAEFNISTLQTQIVSKFDKGATPFANAHTLWTDLENRKLNKANGTHNGMLTAQSESSTPAILIKPTSGNGGFSYMKLAGDSTSDGGRIEYRYPTNAFKLTTDTTLSSLECASIKTGNITTTGVSTITVANVDATTIDATTVNTQNFNCTQAISGTSATFSQDVVCDRINVQTMVLGNYTFEVI